MRRATGVLLSVTIAGLFVCALHAQQTAAKTLPLGAKIFVAPMEDGFDDYLKSAIRKKEVPVAIVDDRSQAQFEITGHSESAKPGAAKMILLGKFHSDEQASIQVADLESGDVVFAYSVNKQNSARGRQSTAEACAKHLKEAFEKKK
jgi:hypothetical protein